MLGSTGNCTIGEEITERKFRSNQPENPLLFCHLSELRGLRGCTHRGHNTVRNSQCLQQTEGLRLLSGALWPSILSLRTLGCVLGLQCCLRPLSPLIPSYRGQSGRAECEADRGLQNKAQISAPLLIAVGQTLSKVPGVGLSVDTESHCCRKRHRSAFGHTTRHKGSPALGASCEAHGGVDPSRSL